MIDYILHFASAAAAKANPLVQQHYDAISDAFAADRVVVIQVWRNSQDTVDGDGNTVHNFMAGFFVLISLPSVVAALRDAAATQLVMDRNKCNARQGGCVVASTVGAAMLLDIRFAPVFSGSDFPWGGLN